MNSDDVPMLEDDAMMADPTLQQRFTIPTPDPTSSIYMPTHAPQARPPPPPTTATTNNKPTRNNEDSSSSDDDDVAYQQLRAKLLASQAQKAQYMQQAPRELSVQEEVKLRLRQEERARQESQPQQQYNPRFVQPSQHQQQLQQYQSLAGGAPSQSRHSQNNNNNNNNNHKNSYQSHPQQNRGGTQYSRGAAEPQVRRAVTQQPGNGDDDSDLEIIQTAGVKRQRTNSNQPSDPSLFTDLSLLQTKAQVEQNLVSLHNQGVAARTQGNNPNQNNNNNTHNNNNSQNNSNNNNNTRNSRQNNQQRHHHNAPPNTSLLNHMMEQGIRQQQTIVQRTNEELGIDPSSALASSTGSSFVDMYTRSFSLAGDGTGEFNNGTAIEISDDEYNSNNNQQQQQQRQYQQQQQQQRRTPLQQQTLQAPPAATNRNNNKSNYTTANVFTLYHSQPSEAARFVEADTITYLRYVHCPVVFPRLHATQHSLQVTNTATNSIIPAAPHNMAQYNTNIMSFIQRQQNGEVQPPLAYNNPVNQTHLQPKQFDEVVLSFTPLLVAKHIVENIRNFRPPLHNVYVAQRFNTLFPISLIGGFVANPNAGDMPIRKLNEDAPIVIEDDDDDVNNTIKQQTNNNNDNNTTTESSTVTTPLLDLVPADVRESIAQQDPWRPTTKVTKTRERINENTGQLETITTTRTQISTLRELPLEDKHILFLYTGQLPQTTRDRIVQHQALLRDMGGVGGGNNNNGENNVDSQFTDGIITHMFEIIRQDVVAYRQLRDMLRPLVMQDIEEMRARQRGLNDDGGDGMNNNNNNNNNTTITAENRIEQRNARNRMHQVLQATGLEGRSIDGDETITTNDNNNNSNGNNNGNVVDLVRSRNPSAWDDGSDDDIQVTEPPVLSSSSSDDDDDDDEFNNNNTNNTENNNNSTEQTQNDNNNNNNDQNNTNLSKSTSVNWDEVDEDDLFDPPSSSLDKNNTIQQQQQELTPCDGQTCQYNKNLIDKNNPKIHARCVRIPPNSSNSDILMLVGAKMTCPLCLCKMKHGIGVSARCGHISCYSCLRRSVSLTRLCPVCRTPMSTKDVTKLYG